MTTSNRPQRTAKEQFDQQAAHYNAQWNQWTEESLKWLLTHAGCEPTDTVLDVATGAGYTALGFAPYAQHVTGLDVSIGMLEQARQRATERDIANVTFIEGTAEALPFPDAEFDLVTCRIAPHHFLSIPKFMQETRRVLRSGGRLALADTVVPNDAVADAWQNQVETLRDLSHVRNYTREEWEQFVAVAGFVLDAIDDASGQIPITLNDWLVKAGCAGEQAETVRKLFTNAPASAVSAFQIEPRSDDDLAFVWQRLVFIAHKL